MSPCNMILLGPPGSGKGTQAGALCDELQVPYIATGDLLREHRDRETELGREAAQYMSRGALVPDGLVIAMILEKVDRCDATGFLLDGFPRTLAQAQALTNALAERGQQLTVVLLLDAPDDTVIGRITGRRQCANGHIYHVMTNPPAVEGVCDRDGEQLFQREDDTATTVRRRLRVYHESTEPLADYYDERGLLWRVDATQAPADVQRDLMAMVRAPATT